MKKEFKVGQIWITRGGSIAEIISIDNPGRFPIIATIDSEQDAPRTFTAYGLSWLNEESPLDLITLQEPSAPTVVDNSEHKKQLWCSVYTAKISLGAYPRDANEYAQKSVEDFEKYFELK